MPRRYLLVWIGTGFPYHCRLAVESIRQADPLAEVEIHLLGDEPPVAHFHEMFGTGSPISLHHIDLDRALDAGSRCVFERIPATARSAQSNLLRLALLHRRGGVYLDFDTFVLRPLHDLAPGSFVGVERVWHHDRDRVRHGLRARLLPGATGWGLTWALKRFDSGVVGGRLQAARRLRRLDDCWHVEQTNNAAIGASAGSDLTAALLAAAPFVDATVRYALGPTMLHDTIAGSPRLATVLPPEVLYPVPPSESHRFFSDQRLVLPPQAALVHYVGSNHRKVLATVGPDDDRYQRPALFWQLAGRMNRCRREQLGRQLEPL